MGLDPVGHLSFKPPRRTMQYPVPLWRNFSSLSRLMSKLLKRFKRTIGYPLHRGTVSSFLHPKRDELIPEELYMTTLARGGRSSPSSHLTPCDDKYFANACNPTASMDRFGVKAIPRRHTISSGVDWSEASKKPVAHQMAAPTP
jgi:hypothetical protein